MFPLQRAPGNPLKDQGPVAFPSAARLQVPSPGANAGAAAVRQWLDEARVATPAQPAQGLGLTDQHMIFVFTQKEAQYGLFK